MPSPEWDAERLLRHALGYDRARILVAEREPLDPAARRRFDRLVAERARRRPLQHLLGVQEFWRREFLVGPVALIPRPETELIVEASLELLGEMPHPVVVDVGTGTGCIALTLAAERPDAIVHATDISAAALRLARRNARALGLVGRVRFHRGDLLQPLERLAGGIDLVVSNPPYIGLDEAASLEPEVRDHEPGVALFVAGDPVAPYRRLAVEARRLLRPGGALVVEVGSGRARKVRRIVAEAGLAVVRVVPDLQAVPRTLVARRPGP